MNQSFISFCNTSNLFRAFLSVYLKSHKNKNVLEGHFIGEPYFLYFFYPYYTSHLLLISLSKRVMQSTTIYSSSWLRLLCAVFLPSLETTSGTNTWLAIVVTVERIYQRILNIGLGSCRIQAWAENGTSFYICMRMYVTCRIDKTSVSNAKCC